MQATLIAEKGEMYDAMNREVEDARLVDEIWEDFEWRRIIFRSVMARNDMVPGGRWDDEAIQRT